MATAQVQWTRKSKPAKASTKREAKQQPAWVRDMVWQQFWAALEG